MTTSQVLVLHAHREPQPGIERPGPHQKFRHPTVGLEERELGPLAPGEVRIEMLLAGLCGSDLHAVQEDSASGYIVGSVPLEFGSQGRVLGHEGVGRIIKTGDGVDGLRVGAVVTFESIVHCNRCVPCRRGDFNQCRHAQLLGMERDGLFASVTDVPATLCHEIDDLVHVPGGLEMAACAEPAACAYVGCSVSRVAAGEGVVIFGAGPIGAFAAMLCRFAFGVGSLTVVEPTPLRRELAAAWADQVYDVEEFFSLAPSNSLDVVIEASGALENVNRVTRLLGANARIALLGRSGRPLAIDAVDHVITNNISIHGSRGNLGGAFSQVLRMIRLQRLPLNETVTCIVDGLDELQGWLKDPDLVTEHHCKVLARIGSLPDSALR